MKAKPKSRKNHLAQTEAGSEGGEKGHGGDGEAVDEEDGEKRVHETQVKDWNGQSTDSKRRDHHVGREPLSSHISTSCAHSRGLLGMPTSVPTFIKLVSVLSSSGTLSIPRGSTPNWKTALWILAYRVSPVMKTSVATAGASVV